MNTYTHFTFPCEIAKYVLLILAFCYTTIAKGADGDTFTDDSADGVILKYEVISEADKTAKIIQVEYEPLNCNLSIPAVVKDYKVVSIGQYAFMGTKLNSVSFRKATYLQEIEDDAFMDSKITTADLKGGCNIRRRAFYNSNNLESVTFSLDQEETIIEEMAFYQCENLKSIELPIGISEIGSKAFSECNKLSNITFLLSQYSSLSSSIHLKIGNMAFFQLNELKSIHFPRNLQEVGVLSFGFCVNLQSLIFENSELDIADEAFSACSNLREVEFPKDLRKIGSDAFFNCAFSSLRIPNCTLGVSAFSGCSNLRSIEFYESGRPCIIEGNLLGYNNNLESITFVEGLERIADRAFDCSEHLKALSFPKSLKSIGAFAFGSCYNIGEISFSEGLDSIGDYAFNACGAYNTDGDKKFTSLQLPEGLRYIGEGAFVSCIDLHDITLPSTLEHIDSIAFFGCNIESLYIPASVRYIGNQAFQCQQNTLKSIVVDEGNPCYDSRGNCSAIIEKATGRLLVGSQSSSIPNDITSIDEKAFYECTQIGSIHIPQGVTSIGEDAFLRCALKMIRVEPGNMSYDSEGNCLIETATNTLLAGCDKSSIPFGIEIIKPYAFYRCEGLEYITIPSSVYEIGREAFAWCTGLISVTAQSITPVTIDDNHVFWSSTYNPKLEEPVTLYVPIGSKELYAEADGWRDFTKIEEKDVTDVTSGVTQSLKVIDENGSDITDNVTIIWYDKNVNELGKGSSINGIKEGEEIFFTISLDEQLGRIYKEVEKQKLIASNITYTWTLMRIGKINLQGRVSVVDIDKNTVTVNVKQMLNGKYEQTFSTQTDEQGLFKVEVYDDETDIIISGDSYLDATLHRDGFNGNGNVGTIPMNLISGFAIGANITLKKAIKAEQQQETSAWSDALNNIEFTLYNVTKNAEISDFAVQNGSIIIKTGVAVSDEIRLTAKSKQGVFADAATMFTIGTNYFNLDLTELGGIEVKYGNSMNSNTIGYLYDEGGQLAAKGSYVGETISLCHLPSGTYTLVTMGSTTLLGNLNSLSDLNAVGLQEGKDYVMASIMVTNGVLSEVSINEVPKIDDSRFYYTTNNTYFTANKTSLTVGNHLTLVAHIDFKSEYDNKANLMNLTIDLPEGCQLVENSVISNRKAVAYTINGNHLSMALNREQWQSTVRFCVIPILNHTYTITAFASFDIDRNVTQPIGTAQFEAKGLALSTPKCTANTNITINGTANGHSEVSIYDNDVLIGETSSKADGSWTAACELYQPYTHSFHNIYAKIATENGMELTSETRQVEYKKNDVIPQKVTMVYYNPATHFEYFIDFNLKDGSTIPGSYTFFPEESDFTFLAYFNKNDSTTIKKVNIQVLNNDGTVRTLPATFDGKQNCWVATTKYSSSNRLPQNVTIDYEYIPTVIDEDHSESVTEMATTMVNSTNLIQQQLEQNVNLVLKSEKEKALSFDYILKDNHLSYDIEEVEYETAEELMMKNQFEYTEVDNSVIGWLTEWDDNNIYVNAVDITNYYAFRITLSDNKNNNTNLSRRAPEPTPITIQVIPTNIFNGIFALGNFIENCVGVRKYWSVRNDFSNMFDLIGRYQENYNQVRTKVTKMMLAKCSNGNYKLGKTRMQLFEIDKQTISGMEDQFINNYYNFLREYKRKLVASIATDFATMGIMGKINQTVQSARFIGVNSPLNQWLLKKMSSCTSAEATSHLLSNSISTAIGRVVSKTTTGVDKILGYQDFLGTRDNLLAWAAEENKKIMSNYIELENSIERSYYKCEKDKDNENKEEEDDEPYDKHSNGTITGGTAPVNEFMGQGATPLIDPSGFVYEAVLSNRLPGVTTTVYYKNNGEAIKWNAEDYSQQNPLITDEVGFYQWDVPQGEWQVKYEKEGYETTYSDWLPVPPPQLDVNIGMKQSTPPTVVKMRGTTSGITVDMSKYMLPTTMNKNTITVQTNGMTTNGTIETINLEKTPTGDAEYVRKVKFVPEMEFNTSDEVVVTVHKEVESYCGVQMTANHVEKVKIESEIKKLVVDSAVTIPYKDSKTIQIVAQPKQAVTGKSIVVNNSSSMIVSVDKEMAQFDENGVANFTINGIIPGSAYLTFNIEGTDMEATSKVYVSSDYDLVATPEASIKSGETIDKGTLLTLTCSTEEATIYYTLDGSCPCNEATRIKYESPIVINTGVVIKAIAVKDDMDDSDIATFVYVVAGETGIKTRGTDSNISIYYDCGMLIIEGAEGGSCHIYDYEGREITSRSRLAKINKVRVPKANVYIVSVKSRTSESIVKQVVVK